MSHSGDLEARIKSSLDESVVNLSATTRSRLAAARKKALQSRPRQHNYWLPLGAAVAASVIVSALLLFNPTQQLMEDSERNFAILELSSDLELLTGIDDIELYQELDFYRWLDEAQPLESEQHAG